MRPVRPGRPCRPRHRPAGLPPRPVAARSPHGVNSPIFERNRAASPRYRTGGRRSRANREPPGRTAPLGSAPFAPNRSDCRLGRRATMVVAGGRLAFDVSGGRASLLGPAMLQPPLTAYPPPGVQNCTCTWAPPCAIFAYLHPNAGPIGAWAHRTPDFSPKTPDFDPPIPPHTPLSTVYRPFLHTLRPRQGRKSSIFDKRWGG